MDRLSPMVMMMMILRSSFLKFNITIDLTSNGLLYLLLSVIIDIFIDADFNRSSISISILLAWSIIAGSFFIVRLRSLVIEIAIACFIRILGLAVHMINAIIFLFVNCYGLDLFFISTKFLKFLWNYLRLFSVLTGDLSHLFRHLVLFLLPVLIGLLLHSDDLLCWFEL